MNAKDHNRLIGIFLMVHGGIQVLIMLLLCVIYLVMGTALFATAQGDEKFVGVIFLGMIIFVVLMASVIALPQLIGGWKLFKERPNARNWGIAGSIISCLSFPIGTAAGVYGLWFLFGEQGKNFYLGPKQHIAFQTASAPELGNWR